MNNESVSGWTTAISICTSKSQLYMARPQLRSTVNYNKVMETTQCLIEDHTFVKVT